MSRSFRALGYMDADGRYIDGHSVECVFFGCFGSGRDVVASHDDACICDASIVDGHLAECPLAEVAR